MNDPSFASTRSPQLAIATRRLVRQAMVLIALGVSAWQAAAADAGSLRAKYTELREQLRNNDFQRALHIDSTDSADVLRGDVYAVLDHPFATVSEALKEPAQWCDILILPFNTKYCHAVKGQAGPALMVRVGRKFDQSLQDAHRIDFSWRAVAATADYFENRLDAKSGPMGTRDYLISVAAVPLESGRTFLHLSYSYGFGMAGRMAMQGYLATVGANKVGFTATGRDGNGQPQLIGGVRGAVERNAMRYYLAIDSYLDALAAPEAQRVEKRIQGWFDATERYPKQLREMTRPIYVAMKRQEWERQQTAIE